MGTRHIIRVKLDGKIVVSQYGQWDGYPSGQGIQIARFLHGEMEIEKLKAALRSSRFMTKDEVQQFNEEHRGKDWHKTHPWLSRDAGANVLWMIQKNGATQLLETTDEDWCEFFYLVDLDKSTVSMRSVHKSSYPDEITKPFAEWTEDAMELIEKDADSREEQAA